MTWNTLVDLEDGIVVTESDMDDIRENIEHLGSLKVSGAALSSFSASTQISALAHGTFTGNGAATKAVTGLGFQPDWLIVYDHGSNHFIHIKANADGTSSHYHQSGSAGYATGILISLDSDGFTVGLSTGMNVNAAVYTYLAGR